MAWLRTRDIKNGQITNDKLGSRVMHIKKFTYDFAVAGGAVSVITLTDDKGNAQTLPDNAVLLGATCEVITGVTSGGLATLDFGYTGDPNYFLNAEGKASFDADGKAVKMELSTPTKLTAAKSVVMEIKAATLTAGKLNVWVRYYQGD
jgi:tetrahydrodipicolinate N-succinyltransferase